MGTTVQLTTADGNTLNAYRSEPEGSPKGAIIVVQEIFGVNDHIRGVADGYAREGYVAIAPAYSIVFVTALSWITTKQESTWVEKLRLKTSPWTR